MIDCGKDWIKIQLRENFTNVSVISDHWGNITDTLVNMPSDLLPKDQLLHGNQRNPWKAKALKLIVLIL